MANRRPPGLGLGGQIPAHHLDLAVILAEAHHRDLVGCGESVHRLAERGADLLHDRRLGDRVAEMHHHERRHLPADLQIRHIPVQMYPIQTLHIKHKCPSSTSFTVTTQPRPPAWSTTSILTSPTSADAQKVAPPPGGATVAGGQLGPLLNQQPTATIPPKPGHPPRRSEAGLTGYFDLTKGCGGE
jgi:hypothetical protein